MRRRSTPHEFGLHPLFDGASDCLLVEVICGAPVNCRAAGVLETLCGRKGVG